MHYFSWYHMLTKFPFVLPKIVIWWNPNLFIPILLVAYVQLANCLMNSRQTFVQLTDGYGIPSCGVFKGGIQNKQGFWLKINCIQMKLPNFEIWSNGELSKSTIIWLSKSIFYVKNHPNLSGFFSLKNMNLGAYFLLLTFFDNLNF